MTDSWPSRPATVPRRSRGADFLRDERGETMIEYGLIVSLMTIVLVGALQYFGGSTTKLYNKIMNAMVTN